MKSIYTCRYPSEKEIDVLPAAQCFVHVVQTVVRCQLISVSARWFDLDIKYLDMISLVFFPPSSTQVDTYLNLLFLFLKQYFSKSIKC